jgi:integrase
MPDMPRPRPPRLQRGVSRHGKVVWFVQTKRGAPKIRIHGVYGSDEFNAAYDAAVANQPAPKKPEIKASKGTLEWAWLLYKQSASWQSKSKATRRQRENIMKHVLASAGSHPLSIIDDAAISEGVDRRARTPSQAKNFAQTMRQFFKWLKKAKIVSENPCDGLELPKRPKTGGFKEWSYEEILRYEERWPVGTRERVMLDVYMYTGLRRGDAAVVGKQHVRASSRYRPKKQDSGSTSRCSTSSSARSTPAPPATSPSTPQEVAVRSGVSWQYVQGRLQGRRRDG